MAKISKKYIVLVLALYVSAYSGIAFFMDPFIKILRKNGMGLQYL